jgi:hypothetical protein
MSLEARPEDRIGAGIQISGPTADFLTLLLPRRSDRRGAIYPRRVARVPLHAFHNLSRKISDHHRMQLVRVEAHFFPFRLYALSYGEQERHAGYVEDVLMKGLFVSRARNVKADERLLGRCHDNLKVRVARECRFVIEEQPEPLLIRSEVYARSFSVGTPRMDGSFPENSNNEVCELPECDILIVSACVKRSEVMNDVAPTSLRHDLVERKWTAVVSKLRKKPILSVFVKTVLAFLAKKVRSELFLR